MEKKLHRAPSDDYETEQMIRQISGFRLAHLSQGSVFAPSTGIAEDLYK